MAEQDILSDEERDALSEVIQGPDLLPRVLIVDDDADSRQLLAEILDLHDIYCVTADSGEAALRKLESSVAIDLLITDLRMPQGGGLDLIRSVRASDRHGLPIIIVSGNADVRDAIAAMHLKVVDFLLKPIDAMHLVGLVKRELHMV